MKWLFWSELIRFPLRGHKSNYESEGFELRLAVAITVLSQFLILLTKAANATATAVVLWSQRPQKPQCYDQNCVVNIFLNLGVNVYLNVDD